MIHVSFNIYIGEYFIYIYNFMEDPIGGLVQKGIYLYIHIYISI